MDIEEYYDKFFKQDLSVSFEELPMRFQILVKTSYDREIKKLINNATKDARVFHNLYKKIK